MIKPHCHTREWIEAQRAALSAADPGILERAIFALTLLEAVSRSGLDYVFKGGTSLLLHLPRPLRLSIDIDIVCATSREELRPLLDAMVATTPFLRWEEHVRGEQRLPRRLHFKFYYDSPLHPGREVPVLLDVVTEENRLTDVVEKPVHVSFLEMETTVTVKTLSVDALLGDKLTAFAPNTIGVPLTNRYSQQVIKQLFDVGQLFDEITNIDAVATANRTSFEEECGYRASDFELTHQDYLADVIEASRQLCALDLKGAVETDATRLMRRGIGQLPNHLIGCKFRLPEAKVAAAKAAALASLLGRPEVDRVVPVYDSKQVLALKDHRLSDRYQSLQRLKAINLEAYFYWASC